MRPELVDRKLIGTRMEPEWAKLKSQMQSGDQLWPFKIDVQANLGQQCGRILLGQRRGFILLRVGRPVGGITTERT